MFIPSLKYRNYAWKIVVEKMDFIVSGSHVMI